MKLLWVLLCVCLLVLLTSGAKKLSEPEKRARMAEVSLLPGRGIPHSHAPIAELEDCQFRLG